VRRNVSLLAVALAASACKTSHLPDAPAPKQAASAGKDAPAASTEPASPAASAGASAALEEPPLKWGTRPAKSGALFAVVDGMCIHAEVWPMESGALLTYGNRSGAFSRGSTPTLAELTDRGLTSDDALIKGIAEGAWSSSQPSDLRGRWPDRAVMIDDRSGRTEAQADVWVRDGAAWRIALAVGDSPDAASDYHSPFFRGDALFVTQVVRRSDTDVTARLRAVPLGGASKPQVPALFRAGFVPVKVAPWKDEMIAFGTTADGDKAFVRFTVNGAVREEPIAAGFFDAAIQPADGFVFARTARWQETAELLRFDGAHWKKDPADAIVRSRHTYVVYSAVAGDEVWLVLGDGTLWVESKDGAVAERAVPERISNGSSEERRRAHRALRGSVLAGVEQGDPWIVGKSGALYHSASGAWQKVDMPRPPFSTAGAYAAESLVHTADDLFVNAGYTEKESGWRTPEPYRAILRTKRPSETLRCNEPDLADTAASGKGFRSWPPIADDACAAPFAVLLRQGMMQAIGGDYPTVRAVLKGRAALGDKATLVEFKGGDRRYMGMRVPSVTEGKAIAEALGKKVNTRPEIVCGEPPADRTIDVDVASGAVR